MRATRAERSVKRHPVFRSEVDWLEWVDERRSRRSLVWWRSAAALWTGLGLGLIVSSPVPLARSFGLFLTVVGVVVFVAAGDR